jgi:hypothetical protein
MKVNPITVIYKPIFRRNKPAPDKPLRVGEQARTDAPEDIKPIERKGILA